MYILLVVIHVIVCFVLIGVVLLQAGRGGGFSDMMGGAQPQSIFGTQTNAFMTRATEVSAVLFIVTSLSLGILTTQKGKSLMEKRMLVDSMKKSSASLPAAPQEAVKEVAKTAESAKAAIATETQKVADEVKASAEKVEEASTAAPKTV